MNCVLDPLLNPSNLLIAIGRELGERSFTPELLLDRLNNTSVYYFSHSGCRKFTSHDFLMQVAPLLQALVRQGQVEMIDRENYRLSQSGEAALRAVSEY